MRIRLEAAAARTAIQKHLHLACSPPWLRMTYPRLDGHHRGCLLLGLEHAPTRSQLLSHHPPRRAPHCGLWLWLLVLHVSLRAGMIKGCSDNRLGGCRPDTKVSQCCRPISAHPSIMRPSYEHRLMVLALGSGLAYLAGWCIPAQNKRENQMRSNRRHKVG